jgi:ATP-dependent DNA helicase HFM1/MER3
LLNRRPPFGLEVLGSALDLPQYALSIKELEINSDAGKIPVEVHLQVDCILVEQNHTTTKTSKSRTRNFDRTVVLSLTSDMDFIDFRRIP